MARVHPLTSIDSFGIFDSMTGSAVFPLSIVDGQISNETIVFKGKSTEVEHKMSEMINAIGIDGISKRVDEETSVLDCSGIFEKQPYDSIKQLENFQGIIKVDFKRSKFHLFRQLETPLTFKWSPKSVDQFVFKKTGRHSQSSHKIFSEVFQDSGFMFSEIFNHESNMTLVVKDISKGKIADLQMNTFIGEKGNKSHRGIKMVQDATSYLFPYIWTGKVLNIECGTRHKYLNIEFVSDLMKEWGEQNIQGDVDFPIILNIQRGRGKNHTQDITVKITHQLVEVEE